MTKIALSDHEKRQILSYVRRTAKLDARLQKAWETYANKYILDVQDNNTLRVRENIYINSEFIEQYWGNNNPLILEIGSGQGENIVAAAQQNPQTNFLAIEVYDPGVAHTMLMAGKQGIENLRIAQVNAPELLECCDNGVIEEVWTFFPDPWPKKKHHKRRIVQDGLVRSIHKALRNEGVWRIATDIDDYALHVHEVMDQRSDFENAGSKTVSLPIEHVGKGNADDALQLPHKDFTESERFDGRILTNFEKKGIAAHRTIHDFSYISVTHSTEQN